MISSLPQEIWIDILSFLEQEDCLRLSHVNEFFRKIVLNNTIEWRIDVNDKLAHFGLEKQIALFPRLHSLHLACPEEEYSEAVFDSIDTILPSKIPAIVKLSLNDIRVPIVPWPSVRELRVRHTINALSFLKILNTWPQLDLIEASIFPPTMMEWPMVPLTAKPNLQTLQLQIKEDLYSSGYNNTIPDPMHIVEIRPETLFPNLKYLTVKNVLTRTTLSAFPFLTRVHLSVADLNEVTFGNRTMPLLQELRIRVTRTCSDTILRTILHKCPSLERLVLQLQPDADGMGWLERDYITMTTHAVREKMPRNHPLKCLVIGGLESIHNPLLHLRTTTIPANWTELTWETILEQVSDALPNLRVLSILSVPSLNVKEWNDEAVDIWSNSVMTSILVDHPECRWNQTSLHHLISLPFQKVILKYSRSLILEQEIRDQVIKNGHELYASQGKQLRVE